MVLGICVRKGNGNSPQFSRWRDITNLVNHKKYFGIDCQNFEFRLDKHILLKIQGAPQRMRLHRRLYGI